MWILFVSTERGGKTSPLVVNQAKSLELLGNNIDHFFIKGRTNFKYFWAIPKLFYQLLNNKYDLIHAHFSYSGLVAYFAFAKPLVVSFMGSDLNRSKLDLIISKFIGKYISKNCIVKSKKMKDTLGIDHSYIIPNGVDIDKFKPINQSSAKLKLGWEVDKKHILFAADPTRKEKNFPLAKSAFSKLNLNNNYKLHCLENIPLEEVVYHYNAADAVLLTSKYEGSPNVIKEALSCNRPIVCTDVGDVKENFGNINGFYVCKDSSKEIAQNLYFASNCINSTGRNIIKKNLSSAKIAADISGVYDNSV